MRKKALSILMALIMCLSLLPMAAMAAGTEMTLDELFSAAGFDSGNTEEMTQGDAYALLTAAGYDGAGYAQGSSSPITRAEGCEVIAVLFRLPVGENSAIEYLYEQGIIKGVYTEDGSVNLDEDGVLLRVQFAAVASMVGSVIAVPPAQGDDPEGGEGDDPADDPADDPEGGTSIFDGLASDWAKDELEKANELGLIPESFAGQDLRENITRAEFAAVVVNVYESLSGTAAIPAVNNPFTDCSDINVLKAYNIGAVNGTSATTYTPDSLLNREEMATMLTRVFKKVTLVGWTLPTDGEFTLPYTRPDAFADDADISAWAKDSVYFMVANGIIKGMGSNMFAPKNVTSEQEAIGYANATKEQALLIAVRMVENLGE